MDIQFSCTLYSGVSLNKKYNNLISKLNPNKEEMLQYLEYLKNNWGATEMKIDPEPEIGIVELSAECDGEKYLLTLIEYGEDGEYLIRTSNFYEYSDKLVYFEGELFPPSEVIKDFEIVKEAFTQLLETGNVSYDLMS